MADGRDFVTGTAVGAPVAVIIATAAGALLSVLMAAVHRYVWGPLSAALHARVSGSKSKNGGSLQRGRRTVARRKPADNDLPLLVVFAVAAAGGGAQFMIAASAILSQSAVAAAVLRAAEGAVDGTPSWYPALAVTCALLSFVPTMAAVWLAWPSQASSRAVRVAYAATRPPLAPTTAPWLRPRGLRAATRQLAGDDGRWVAAIPSGCDTSVINSHTKTATAALKSGIAKSPSGPAPQPSHRPTTGALPPAKRVEDEPQLLGDPFLELAAASTPVTRGVVPPAALASADDAARLVRPAAGVAWREALYSEYRGHARFAAQFVVASQALQGLAQAAGELVPRGVPDAAWWSCVTAATAQLVVMSFCALILSWMRPQRSRRNYDVEVLPTVLQAGICAPVVLLAARRWTPNATIAAGVDAALDASALLQPVLGVGLAVSEAAAEVDFGTVAAFLRRTHTCAP
jgi:hypothetical protein